MGVLNGGAMPTGWNDIIIVLILKVNKPERLKELRPISLCTVLYKLISKVLANRLKLILPDIISQSQSAFVPGHLITDNVLLAYELTHYLKNKRRGRKGVAAIKLDMSKAYDRVEWNFLHKMMVKMGFSRQWVDLIMKCVLSVNYRIKVNGEYTDTIVSQRGLRQGDPLSPYLFILCAEGLSALLQKAENEKKIAGIKVSRGASSVKHLYFADDSLILMRADNKEATELKRILSLYERVSGQMINKDKSAIVFSPNTGRSMRDHMMVTLAITQETWGERYLGLLVSIGKSRKKTFSYIKQKVWARVQG